MFTAPHPKPPAPPLFITMILFQQHSTELEPKAVFQQSHQQALCLGFTDDWLHVLTYSPSPTETRSPLPAEWESFHESLTAILLCPGSWMLWRESGCKPFTEQAGWPYFGEELDACWIFLDVAGASRYGGITHFGGEDESDRIFLPKSFWRQAESVPTHPTRWNSTRDSGRRKKMKSMTTRRKEE